MEVENNFSLNENFSCGKWNWTESEVKFEIVFGWWIHGVVSIVIGIFGIIVNFLFFYVLTSRAFCHSLFNKLIASLTLSDTIFLLCSVYDSFRLHILDFEYCSILGYLQLMVYPLRKISMCFSIYLTIVLSFERFMAVTNPIHHRNRDIGNTSCVKELLKYITPVIVVSFIIFGCPQFFAFRMTKTSRHDINNTNASNQYAINEGTNAVHCLEAWWRMEKIYILVFSNITTFIITGFIPFLSLFILNYKIYKGIKNALAARRTLSAALPMISFNYCIELKNKNEEKEIKITPSVILFVIVASFSICHILRVVLNLEEIIYYEEVNNLHSLKKNHGIKCVGVQFWTVIASAISHMMLQVHSSINLFIYTVFSKRFRLALRNKIFCFRNSI